MFRVLGKQARGLLILLTVLAIALAACSGGSTSATPTGGGNPSGGNGGGNPSGGTELSGAAAKLAAITSYKFGMTLAGPEYADMLSLLGGATGTGNQPITLSGTIVLKPEKAFDITMADYHMIEVGGNDYIDIGGTGTYLSNPATSTSLADTMTPSSMFSSMIDASTLSGFNKVATEQKNSVSADHYVGSAAVLAQLGSLSGVNNATWMADIWIAVDGGYPISMAIVGTAADKSIAYEILFDLTNVNDPANKVTAPSA